MNNQEYLDGLSDQDLMAAFDVAKDDLTKAASDEPNSEWHGACFAGVIVFAGEVQKRGLSSATKH